MIPGLATLGDLDLVLGDLPPGGDVREFDRFVDASHREDVWTLEIAYRARGKATTETAELSVLGDMVLGEMEIGGTDLAPIQRALFSKKLWIARPDEPGPRHTSAFCRLLDPLSTTISGPLTASESSRALSITASSTLSNRQGELDWLAAGTTIDGLEAIVRNGPRRGYWSDLAIRYRGLGQVARGGDDEIRIDFQTRSRVDLALLNSAVFGGTGGFDGDPELAGVPRDLALGFAWNVTPQLVSQRHSVYVASTGRSRSIPAVYEGMIPLTPTADYPNFSALVSAVVPPGHYATCLAESAFRLNGPPVGFITCTIEGLVSGDGLYRANMADWIEWVLRNRSGLTVGEIDYSSFSFIPRWGAGWHTRGRAWTVGEFLDEMCLAINAFHGLSRFGLYRIRRVFAPETYSFASSLRIPGLALREEQVDDPILSEQPVLVALNQTVLSPDRILPNAPDDLAERAQREGRVLTVPNGGNVYPLAVPGPLIRTPFNTNEAEEIGRQAIEIGGTERDTFSASIPRETSLDIGDPVAIATDRFGAGGQIMLVREIKTRGGDGPRGSTQLRLFGATGQAARSRLFSRREVAA